MRRLSDELTTPPAWLEAGPFVVEDCGYAMDGGSISLAVRDHEGREHRLLLSQHMIGDAPQQPPRFDRQITGKATAI